MLWLLRIVLVGLTAAAMSVVGLALIPETSLRPGGYAGAAALSVVLWLCLCPLVDRQGAGMAVSVGLLSPLIALGPLAPYLVFCAVLDVRYAVVFVTGALTGILVWGCLATGQGRGPGKAKRPDEPCSSRP